MTTLMNKPNSSGSMKGSSGQTDIINSYSNHNIFQLFKSLGKVKDANVKWTLTAEERKNYDQQFEQLKPLSGFVRGDQARVFFLKSNLPPAILGQIWELADINGDGKMDKYEFSIAMKLIKLKLQGINLPTVLPPTLKQPPSTFNIAAFAKTSTTLNIGASGITNSSISNMNTSVFSMPSSTMGMGMKSTMSNGSASMMGGGGMMMPGMSATLPAGFGSNTLMLAAPSTPGLLPPMSGMGMGTGTMGFGSAMGIGTGTVGTGTMSLATVGSVPPATVPVANISPSTTSGLQDWAIPKQSKLKYVQLFNSHDMMKTGFLSGNQARHILSSTGLTHQMLAQIWNLSDIDKDGRLTQDEFVVAMYLSDLAKSGNLLPSTLPPSLVPPSYRRATVKASNVLMGDLANLLEPEKKSDVESMPSVFTSFEDKRRDNFNKGNIELERRRFALEEEQRKERERQEQKEREERERREKERLEQERKRQAQVERQLERQRAAEREREEARRKAIEQREAAQREMERQRQLEWERIRRQELLQQKLREQEAVTSLHAKTKELDVEITALSEKTAQLSVRVSDIKAREKEQKMAVETMNRGRDLKIAAVAKRQEELKGLSNMLNTIVPEKQNFLEQLNQCKENSVSDSEAELKLSCSSKRQSLSQLRSEVDKIRKESAGKLNSLENFNNQLNQLREELNKRNLQVEAMNRIQQDKVRDLQTARREREASLIRKNSMEKIKKQQQKLAAESFMRMTELKEATSNTEPPKKENKPFVAESLQKEKETVEKENTFLESKKRAEEEIKRVDVKRRIAEMQQKRMEKKMMQEPVYATVSKPQQQAKQPSSTAAHSQSVVASTTADIDSAKQEDTTLTPFKALYNFEARNPDELGINEGETVMVNEKEDGEPGWYSGVLNGKRGWFPANYVEKITTLASHVSSASNVQATSTPAIQPPPQSAKPNRLSVTSAASESIQPSKSSAFSAANRNDNLSPVPGKGQNVSSFQCKALYPWQAKKENHLTFDKDDIIVVSEQQAMWWFGSCKGKSGWFPKSYVKNLSSLTPVIGNKPASPKTSPVVKRKAPVAPQQQKQPTPAVAGFNLEYVANYAFAGIEKEDLSFDVGDVISVTEKNGDWWTGTLKGRTGIFPANYVAAKAEPAQPPSAKPSSSTASTTTTSTREIATVIAPYTAAAPNQLSLEPNQLVLIKKKSDSGWWEGELQARGKKKQIGWFPANYVKVRTPGHTKGKAPTPQPKLPETLCQVLAMYDYTAQNNDELSFGRGTKIHVTEQNDMDWWSGYISSKPDVIGLFPSNYVREMAKAELSGTTHWTKEQSAMTPEEIKRQQHIHELIVSEESYLKDLEMANKGFRVPLQEKKLLTEQELNTLFINWNELLMCSVKLVKAFRVRRKNSGDGAPGAVVSLIGDILCEQLPNLHPYVRFCSCQLNASSLLQEKIDNDPEFKKFVKSCESGTNFKGLPVSSYLVKPMQRITKYPLLIEKVLKYTPDGHVDHNHLKLALERAEEICSHVNEGVREKENADRLEWIQTHVQLDGLNEKLIFNSTTNCLGQRRFLHCGTLYKHKSNKELVGFLFNDFLMFTTATRPLNIPVNDFIFSSKNNLQFKLYKVPIFLNEVLIRLPTDPSPAGGNSTSNEELAVFHLSHVDRVYNLRAENINERTAWTNKIKTASQFYIDTEKKKREKAHHVRSQRSAGIGRLMVTIVEGCNLIKTGTGRHDPYCEVTMGVQSHTTKTVQDTLNPKWNSTMQFFVKDIKEDVLCVSVFRRDMFSPDDFLGRTEVKVADIKRDIADSKGPLTKKLLLHEVESGDVVVKVDLQLFERES